MPSRLRAFLQVFLCASVPLWLCFVWVGTMSLFDLTPAEALYADRHPQGWGGRWYGCHVAQVVDLVDP
ncbi:hypothetical protein DBR42_03630, partial [Pelomonas sp. HMWF004]